MKDTKAIQTTKETAMSRGRRSGRRARKLIQVSEELVKAVAHQAKAIALLEGTIRNLTPVPLTGFLSLEDFTTLEDAGISARSVLAKTRAKSK